VEEVLSRPRLVMDCAWYTEDIVFGAHLVCIGVGNLKLFRTDPRISRELVAYPIKPAKYSSSKEGLVD